MKKYACILLIDDDDIDIESIQRALKKDHVITTIYIRKNGLEALELLQDKDFKTVPIIVILDIKMPKMSGFGFLKKLRADKKLKSTLVFILTSSREKQDIKKAYSYNVAGYIVKQPNFEDFLENIKVLSSYCSMIELPNEKD